MKVGVRYRTRAKGYAQTCSYVQLILMEHRASCLRSGEVAQRVQTPFAWLQAKNGKLQRTRIAAAQPATQVLEISTASGTVYSRKRDTGTEWEPLWARTMHSPIAMALAWKVRFEGKVPFRIRSVSMCQVTSGLAV